MNKLRTTLLSFILFIGSSAMFAQGLPYSMTVNAGVNASDMDIQDTKTRIKAGFIANATFEYNLPRSFFLQTGIAYSQKGAKVRDSRLVDARAEGKETTVQYSRNGKYNANYISIPLMAGYRLPVSDVVRMNLSVGPYFAFGVGGKTNLTVKYERDLLSSFWDPDFKDNVIEYEDDTFTKDNLRSFDMGIAGNVGIEYARCLLNVGYEYGILDQMRTENMSSYNLNFYASVGFRIF